MQLEVSAAAAGFVRAQGGQLWVWAARPRMCCGGTPAFMHAATAPPGLTGFSQLRSAGLQVWFRAPAGRFPDVLGIGLHKGRRPQVEAYWDGCAYVL